MDLSSNLSLFLQKKIRLLGDDVHDQTWVIFHLIRLFMWRFQKVSYQFVFAYNINLVKIFTTNLIFSFVSNSSKVMFLNEQKILLCFLYSLVGMYKWLKTKLFFLDFKVAQIFNFWDRWMKVRSPQGQKRLVRLREMGRHFTPASAPWYLYVPWSQTIWPQVLNSLELSGTLHEDKNPVSPTLFFHSHASEE